MLDLLLLPLATALAFTVRFEGLSWVNETGRGPLVPRLIAAVKVAIAYWAGLYRGLWRHASLHELEQFFKAGALSGAVCFMIGAVAIPGLGLAPVRIPLSVLVLDMLLAGAVLTMPRLAVRVITSHLRRIQPSDARRVLIAGAGAAGVYDYSRTARQSRHRLEPGWISRRRPIEARPSDSSTCRSSARWPTSRVWRQSGISTN